MKPWKRIEPTEITKVGWRTVVAKTFETRDGKTRVFQTFNEENSHNAGVVALTKKHEVIVAKQFRVGQQKIMMELPGGGVEPHEIDFQMTAVRELQEETGYVPDRVISLGSVYKDAYNNSTWHYFLAFDCELHPEGQQLDEHEDIEVELISIDEFISNAKNGLMTDTEAVFLAYDELMKIKKEQDDESHTAHD